MSSYSYSEFELRQRYINSAKREEVKLFPEVPVFCRSVDLVEVNNTKKRLTAIEFKLNNWKKAILQVKDVSICFDSLYICLPRPKKKNSEKKILNECMINGVGLLFYDENQNKFEKVLEGNNNRIIWRKQKEIIIEYLEKSNG